MNPRLGILWFVLDNASSAKLRQAVPPAYGKEYYHHVTLQYSVERETVPSFVGKQWTILAYAVALGKDTQACRVQTNGLPDMYGVPHVTLSTDPGIKPYASVAMLQTEHTETPLDPPLTLSGTVQFEYLDKIKD